MLQRLVLLRHGRTTWNAEARMQGRLDPELDEVGYAEAAAAAPFVAAFKPAALWASDQRRAWATAGFAAAETGLDARPDPRLRETSVGDWEGLTGREVDDGWPGGLESWRSDPTWAPPNGESRVEVAQRAAPVVDDVAAELVDLDDATALLVAHGGTIIALTASTLGWPVSAWPSLSPLRNCHWAVLEHRIDRWRLAAWGIGAASS